VYETSCTVYVYFGFGYFGLPDPVASYERIEHALRDEVLKCGGSVSHHHGVGKIRKQFMPEVVDNVGLEMLASNKKFFDPKNIFATGNLIDHPDFPSKTENTHE